MKRYRWLILPLALVLLACGMGFPLLYLSHCGWRHGYSPCECQGWAFQDRPAWGWKWVLYHPAWHRADEQWLSLGLFEFKWRNLKPGEDPFAGRH